ncbi:unnamed protein product [Rhizoctonia solani]|nr:unnamed protein product [Rhizoctonia solani]
MVHSAIFTTLLLSGSSLAAIVPYNFRIRNVQAAPDGFQRSVVSVNGLIPGTLITANKGDTLLINVTNELTDASMRRATTIHWHGLFQSTTASEDGPAFGMLFNTMPDLSVQLLHVSDSSWTADWNLLVITRSHRVIRYTDMKRFVGIIATYHRNTLTAFEAHFSYRYSKDISTYSHTTIIDPQDPHRNRYDVDDASTVITLDDWYHTPAPTLQAQFFDTNNTALAAPVPDAGLINGRGRYLNGPQVPRTVINVQRGRRYRLRIINTSSIGSYTFSIENHRMTIIEADGISHQPLIVDSFQIYAGQRYSVVVEANQTIANYWIRSPMTVANAANNANLDATNVFAVLRYQGAPNAEPTTEQGTAIGTPLVEENLHALINPGAPGGSNPADVQVNLTIGRTTIDGKVAFTFNGIQYKSPSLPTLLKILANNATTNADFGTDEHTLALPFNKTIELVITGGVDHPIHLHGHVFDVVQSLGGSINYVNPPRHDVVRVSSTGVILRFRTDNPGPWFVHCHIDWHLEAGLAVVFAEAPDQARIGPQRVVPAPGWDQLCPKYTALSADLQ